MKFLSYNNFISLLSSLDKYAKKALSRDDLLTAIFDHYISKGTFIVENNKGDKWRFCSDNLRKSDIKYFRKQFKKFMNNE